MKKYIDCDIISVLGEVMEHHTKHFKTDFDIDKEIFAEAIKESNEKNKRLLWLSRPCGTNCLPEREVYLKDTYAHNTRKFYGEQTTDRIKAYAVTVKREKDGIILGDLFELDYQKHFREVVKNSLPIDNLTINFKDGNTQNMQYCSDWRKLIDTENIQSVDYYPQDSDDWNDVLQTAKSTRETERRIPWNLDKLQLENCDKNTYSIYQLKDDAQDNLFLGYTFFEKKGIQPSANDYERVYIDPHNNDCGLDEIYDLFNINRPKDFYGHSLSVSDIIAFNNGIATTAFFVDTCGFKELPHFFNSTNTTKKDMQM